MASDDLFPFEVSMVATETRFGVDIDIDDGKLPLTPGEADVLTDAVDEAATTARGAAYHDAFGVDVPTGRIDIDLSEIVADQTPPAGGDGDA
jgi:hypothetical protein